MSGGEHSPDSSGGDREPLEGMELSLYRAMGKAGLRVAAVPDIAATLVQDLEPKIAERAEQLALRRIEEREVQAREEVATVVENHHEELAALERKIESLENRLKTRLPRQAENDKLKDRVAGLKSDLKDKSALIKERDGQIKSLEKELTGKNQSIRELHSLRGSDADSFDSFLGHLSRILEDRTFFGGLSDHGCAKLESLIEHYRSAREGAELEHARIPSDLEQVSTLEVHLERLRTRADQLQKEGDYEGASRLLYGEIPDAEEKLADLQGRMSGS